MKIIKGDKVKVIAGKDKGKIGRVLTAYPSKQRVKVEGVALKTKHNKPNQQNQEGSISQIEGTIHISNVALIDPKSKSEEITKVKYKFDNGRKVRVAKKSGAIIE